MSPPTRSTAEPSAYPASRGAPSIALVLPSGWVISGVVSWVIETASRLQHLGHRVVLVEHACRRPGDAFQPPAHIAGATVNAGHRVLGRRSSSVYQGMLPATIIPNWGMETYAICAHLSRHYADRMRIIGVCHADEQVYYDLLSRYEPIIHRFIAVSDECAARLRVLCPHRQRDIVVKPCAVRVPREFRRSYSQPGEPIRLLYASRIEQKQKRVYELPRLAQTLHDRGVPFHLTIAGGGPNAADLKALVQRLPQVLRDQIDMKGVLPPDRIPELLLSHDIALLVSAYEGTAVFMLEAMAHGCVPVVTRVSGTSAAIEEGQTGHSVAVGDMPGMAQAISDLSADRARLTQMGHAAHASAQRFSHEDYGDWLVQLHRDIWHEPPRAWPEHRSVLPLGSRLLGLAAVGATAARHGLAGWVSGR
jgi:glycosyltransferase involved in cell wall biosynthesis